MYTASLINLGKGKGNYIASINTGKKLKYFGQSDTEYLLGEEVTFLNPMHGSVLWQHQFGGNYEIVTTKAIQFPKSESISEGYETEAIAINIELPINSLFSPENKHKIKGDIDYYFYEYYTKNLPDFSQTKESYSRNIRWNRVYLSRERTKQEGSSIIFEQPRATGIAHFTRESIEKQHVLRLVDITGKKSIYQEISSYKFQELDALGENIITTQNDSNKHYMDDLEILEPTSETSPWSNNTVAWIDNKIYTIALSAHHKEERESTIQTWDFEGNQWQKSSEQEVPVFPLKHENYQILQAKYHP